MTEKLRSHDVSHAEIDEDLAGQRLDNYLLARLKGVPRSHVYRLIRSGQVRVNSGRVRPMYRLKAGDSVRLPPVRQRPPSTQSSSGEGLGWLAERIVYEDSRLLVVDKPSGLAVHGGSGLNFGLIEGLRSLRPDSKTLELVHRLDRGTSGCLLVAKRRSALRQLHELIRNGEVTKRYLALVQGRWERGEVEIRTPLTVERDGGGARVRPDVHGKPSSSTFRIVNQFGSQASLMDVEIATGRTHQIRVHAATTGHPVAGDERYGDIDFNAACRDLGLKRIFLHAHLIEFAWPDSGEDFMISAPLPGDLNDFLNRLAPGARS